MRRRKLPRDGRRILPYPTGAFPPQPEAIVLKSVRLTLQAYGFFVVRIHQGLGSQPGVPDLYAVKAGRHVWIEVKSQRGGKQSGDQLAFEEQITAHGGEYRIVQHPDQLSDLRN